MDGSPSRVCFPRLTHTSYWPGCQSLESSSSDGSLSPRAELTFSPPSHSHLHSSCKTSRNDISSVVFRPVSQGIKAESKDRETTIHRTSFKRTRLEALYHKKAEYCSLTKIIQPRIYTTLLVTGLAILI